MTDPQTPQPSSQSRIPPPPPSQPGSGRGCLKVGLIGCGVLVALIVVGIAAFAVWWNRNSDEFTASAGTAARDGARFGLVRDEAACFEEAKRRAAASATLADNFSVGTFARSCMEYSRETPGFCDDVPPPTSLRRSMEWQQQRCGDDAVCRNVAQVVSQYCTAGRPKRTAADTLLMGDSTLSGAPPSPPGDGAASDSGSGTF